MLLPVTRPQFVEEILKATVVPEESGNGAYFKQEKTSEVPLVKTIEAHPGVRKWFNKHTINLLVCDCFYNSSHGNTKVPVIPRRAYFDRYDEPRTGDVVTVLAEVNDSALEDIKYCEVNGYVSNLIKQVRENTVWVRKRYPKTSYSLVMVKCFNIPSEALVHDSPVHLIYEHQTDDCFARVKSERPLIVRMIKMSTFERGPNSVLICIPVFKRPLYMDVWLKYQKHIGIDMVHIAADPSFSANATSDYPYLGQALNSSFATMEVWTNPVGEERESYFGQLLKLQDCIMKYRGVFEYMFLIDSDEFFTPMKPTEPKIGYYIKTLFHLRQTATACFQWVKYFCQVHPSRDTVTGNLTATLDDYTQLKVRREEKCIHRINGVSIVDVHQARQLVPGHRTIHVAHDVSYVAHFHPKKQC